MRGEGVSHSRNVFVYAFVSALAACSSQAGTGTGTNPLATGGGYAMAMGASSGQTFGNGGAPFNPAAGGAGNTGPFGNGGSFGPGGAGAFPNPGGVPNFGGNPPIGGFPPAGGGIGPGAGGLPVGGGAPGTGGMVPPGNGGNGGVPVAGCPGESIAPTMDYGANGPFPAMTVNNTGSDGMYTVFRPTQLGMNGFKHPIATWGNGITTTPSYYPTLLTAVASHGIVVIASNSSNVTAQLMTAGLDWMIQQNSGSGEYAGKLNPTCLVTIGYSLGGGASVTAGAHKDVVVTASMHGVQGASNTLHAPLLLLTSETDTFVVPATFVTPTFTASTVQTFYGTLSTAADPSNTGHLIPVDLIGGAPNALEHKAVIAWLRYWVYGDQGARSYFWGDDCVLCKAPWAMAQRKNWH
jgi:hypothetical protein